MKKFLSTAAALGLIAGLAGSASAADLKLEGSYEVNGIYFDHGNGAGVQIGKTTPEATNDAFYVHSMYVQPTIQVSDKLAVHGDIWLIDRSVWGDQTGAAGSQPVGDTDTAYPKGGTAGIHKLFLEYESPIGKISIGRQETLDFGPSFLDSDLHQDRIMWWPSFMPEPMKLLVYTAKVTEGDGLTANTADQDADYYEARLYHTSTPGTAVAGFGWLSDHSDNLFKFDKYRFMAAGDYTFGMMYLQAEGEYDFGTKDYSAATPDEDLSAMAFMADVGAKVGSLKAGGMFFYASGDDNAAADGDLESFMDDGIEAFGLGEDFEPLYILTGRFTGLLNPYYDVAGTNAEMTRAGILCLVAHADYRVDSKLNLHAAVGYGLADAERVNWEDDYGLEFNMGASYKLLDNLTYSLHAGYLLSGDFFKEGATYPEVEDIIMVSHQLTMEF